MGNCLGGNEDTSRNAEASDSSLGGHRRNQPLRPEKPKWKSDIPLTDGQLRSKRDEFWDTAPAFEGRKEIWDALKAASYALETNDQALAQAIIDGASISLPTGNLTECYDELGNRYQLPVYVLNSPANLIEEGSDADTNVDTDSEIGIDVSIKFRLSSGKDFKMTVRTTDTVSKIKRRIQQEEGLEVNRQRWFFSGKVLNDKLRIEDAKIPKGFIVQIIVAPSQVEKPPPVSS